MDDSNETRIHYKSSSKVHKSLHLRALFAPKELPSMPHEPNDAANPVLLELSPRPRVWHTFDGAFPSVESAMNWVPELEAQGFRVKVLEPILA